MFSPINPLRETAPENMRRGRSIWLSSGLQHRIRKDIWDLRTLRFLSSSEIRRIINDSCGFAEIQIPFGVTAVGLKFPAPARFSKSLLTSHLVKFRYGLSCRTKKIRNGSGESSLRTGKACC